MEKGEAQTDDVYELSALPRGNSHVQSNGAGSKVNWIKEAGELYGNVETAEHYGYVNRRYVHIAARNSS